MNATIKAVLLTVGLCLLSLSAANAQNPKLGRANIRFTSAAFETHHWIAHVQIRNATNARYTYEVSSGIQRIQFPSGETFAKRKGERWKESSDWGKTGIAVDGTKNTNLNTFASVATLPLNEPTSNDRTQGGFVWKFIGEAPGNNCRMFTYEQSRENPRPNGVYPRFTFIKYKNDPDGKLLLMTFQGQFNMFGQTCPVSVRYDMMIPIKANIKVIEKN